MLDLTEYGFVQTGKTDTYTEFSGYGFRILLYDYPYTTFLKQVLNRKSFVVHTKYTTSRSCEMNELPQWLSDKGINKINQSPNENKDDKK
jgi:hypothetical protein